MCVFTANQLKKEARNLRESGYGYMRCFRVMEDEGELELYYNLKNTLKHSQKINKQK